MYLTNIYWYIISPITKPYMADHICEYGHV